MLGSRAGGSPPAGGDNGGYDDGYGAPAPAPVAPRRPPAPMPAARPAPVAAAAAPRAPVAPPPKASSGFDDMDDDIPF